MARVHFVKSARKDNPAVKAGESYYWWKFRFGGKRFSRTRPRASQLTQSEHLSTLYSVMEVLEDLSVDDFNGDRSDPGSELEAILDEQRSLVEERLDASQEALDNMPEGLQDSSSSGEMLTERIDACEQMESELDDVIGQCSEIEGLDEDTIRTEAIADVADKFDIAPDSVIDSDNKEVAEALKTRFEDLWQDACDTQDAQIQEIIDAAQAISYDGP